MKTEMENGCLEQDFLSNELYGIELYYTPPKKVAVNSLLITGEECSHIFRVMRHKIDDEIFVTDGEGSIFKTRITSINKNETSAIILKKYSFLKEKSNLIFCIPRMKNADRFEFALEKSVELGIKNFVIFQADRSVAKGEKLQRWEKILIAAMKQSLNCYLPKIEYLNRLQELNKKEGNKILFEQKSDKRFQNKIKNLSTSEKYFFIFGPEGGLSAGEIELFKNVNIYSLGNNRLRSETAVIKTAALLSD